ncbi:complex I NDUFA9 subunit family protein [Roseibium sp. RKSG952]|uniref:complex I NDUFA9 subunit family protein n=1 Tax=Roseibium sp. RKSG952 TaxID=2529384 RepID=UPI0012BD0644|nr:complex I NDUFA9 subunit family protein [Roseibium sp. RKSG952]MTI02917.1 complex I NDUFA9 subunit family protein [Roseibium sp. RKSG952]
MATTKTGETAVVLGGTGFLGRRVVRELKEAGFIVSVATRFPENAVQLGIGDESSVGVVRCDLKEPERLRRVFNGAAVVVNCIGFYSETRSETFQDIHVIGARSVAEAAISVGVRSLIHVSGIGADRNSRSAYVRARAEGERVVLCACPDATILRPSVLFSRSGAFFCDLGAIVQRMPIFPLFGDGSVQLQPVWVGDVARAAVRVSGFSDARGRIYELGGPDVLTYKDIVQRLARRGGKKRLLVPVPYQLWWLLAMTMAALPQPPITTAQVALMRQDNVVGDNVATFSDLEIHPQSAVALGLI